jgi:zinc protease
MKLPNVMISTAVAVLLVLGCAGGRPAQNAAPAPTAPASPPDAWREGQPAPLPGIPRFAAPVPAQRMLPNRLPVLLRENHAVPVVVVELLIKTGVDGDPPGKPGLADLVAAAMEEGTRSRTAQQLAEQLEDLAAYLNVTPALDGIRLHLNCLTDTLEPALDLLADVALNPAFRPADLERVRGLALTAIRQRQANPGALASDEVLRLLYGPKHPWGQPTGGTVESVRSIRREDLVRFHDTYFRPNNALLSVSGDVEPDRIVGLLAHRFGAWRPRALPPSHLPPFPKEGARTVVVVDQPETTQSQIAVASRTISAIHPEALALSTANVALGGLFTSRLNMQLREVRGWSYGVASGVGFNKKTGTVQVRGSVKAQHTVDSVRDVEEVVQRFATGDITDAELTLAKEGIVRQLPSALETNDAVASSFVTLTQLGRPLDWYATLPDRLAALSREEVARAAREHLDPAHWPVVVVGPRSDLEGLSALKLGPVVDRTAEATGGSPRPAAGVPAAR